MSESRTGEGLIRLRGRFVRRAEFLARNPSFLDELRDQRKRWNARYPEYPIGDNEDPRFSAPRMLRAAVAAEMAVSADDSGDWFVIGPAERALESWNALVTRCSDRYWSPMDYPHPFPPDRHPARPFVMAMLFRSDPYDSVDAEQLIPIFGLEPEPMGAIRGNLATDGLGPDEDVGWCLPLYPDMTPKDFEDAASDLAARVRSLYAGRTANARMFALRTEGQGMTLDAIADQLGIDRKTVEAKLKGIPRGRSAKS